MKPEVLLQMRRRRPYEVRKARRLVRMVRAQQQGCENLCVLAVLLLLGAALAAWTVTALAYLWRTR